MLTYDRLTGPALACEACQQPMTSGRALWALRGQRQTTVMTVHDSCLNSPMIEMLLGREFHNMPLVEYLEKLFEAVSV